MYSVTLCPCLGHAGGRQQRCICDAQKSVGRVESNVIEFVFVSNGTRCTAAPYWLSCKPHTGPNSFLNCWPMPFRIIQTNYTFRLTLRSWDVFNWLYYLDTVYYVTPQYSRIKVLMTWCVSLSREHLVAHLWAPPQYLETIIETIK